MKKEKKKNGVDEEGSLLSQKKIYSNQNDKTEDGEENERIKQKVLWLSLEKCINQKFLIIIVNKKEVCVSETIHERMFTIRCIF